MAHALNRFGLGRRGIEPLPSDPAAWLAEQLDGQDPRLATPEPSAATAFAAIAKEDAYNRNPEGPRPEFIGTRFRADLAAAMAHAIGTDRPFRERLVLFWANHFTVSARAGGRVLAQLGAYLQEAIRPHVTGNFQDMLIAVMRHPGMLYYLDNDGSVGPNSPYGLRSKRGLNENLARECLELHTLGLASRYTQADVTSFARILTGWSVDGGANPGFLFRRDWHEPGDKTLLGETFPEGEAGGMAALKFLARHPATLTRLATQLLEHFSSDTPDARDVALLAGVLRDTQGDLRAAALALIRLPSAWQPLTKLREPVDYAIAIYRALDITPGEGTRAEGMPAVLGQPFWNPPLPNGWNDAASDWTGGEAMVRRADLAWQLAGRPAVPDAMALAARTLGDLLSQRTRAQVAEASTPRDALALLLASPEFMRR